MDTAVAEETGQAVDPEVYAKFKNQLGLVDPDVLAKTSFLVIGAGAIGSYFTMLLAKMGAKNITIFDNDTIEEHNIRNQVYPTYAIGLPKVEALTDIVKDFGDMEVGYAPVNAKFQEVADNYDIVVCCVDSLKARNEIFDIVKKMPRVKRFIDGRMGGLVMRVYHLDPHNTEHQERYQRTLDAKPYVGRCTEKSIIFTVALVTGFMLAETWKAVTGKGKPQFETTYGVQNNLMTLLDRDF